MSKSVFAFLPLTAVKVLINNKEVELYEFDTILPAGINRTGLAKFSLSNLNNRYADIADQAGEVLIKYVMPDGSEKSVMGGYIAEAVHELANKAVRLTCRDYTGELAIATDQEKVYRNYNLSLLVKDLIDTFASWCTTNNVETTTDTVPYLKVEEGKNLLQALIEIAGRYNRGFYVDVAKDFHWFEKGTTGTPKAVLEEGVNLQDAATTREIGSIVNKYILKCKVSQPTDRDFWTEVLTNWLCYDEAVQPGRIAVEDSYVYAANPNANYGTETLLKTQRTTTEQKRSYIKFDTDLVTDEPTACAFKIYKVTNVNSIERLCKVTDDTWTETGVTWNNKPTLGDTISPDKSTPGPVYYSWDVLSYLQEAISQGRTKLGFALIMPSGTNLEVDFYSRENAAAEKPVLVLTGIWKDASSWGGSLDSTKKVFGSYSLKFNSSVKKTRYPKLKNLALSPSQYTRFIISLCSDAAETVTLRLHKNKDNYRSASLNVQVGDFQEFDLTIADMTLTGTVDQINYFEFEFPKTTNTYIDKLHFMAEVKIVKEDAASQTKWGLKPGPLIPEEVEWVGGYSDGEAYAQQKLDVLKEPMTSISNLVITPDLIGRFYNGDTVTVKIPSAKINLNYIVCDPRHVFSAEAGGILFQATLSEYRQEMAEILARQYKGILTWQEED